ncbi:MAG: cupin-like domain-containing protein [Pseudoxanthomonas sp.]
MNESLRGSPRALRPGREPTRVRHDCHASGRFSDEGLRELLQQIPEECIKAKVAKQQRDEAFNTRRIPRQALVDMLKAGEQDFWIALHEIESNPLLKPLFTEMVEALRSSLPPFYGDVRFCTGSLFISQGAASTPFHLDYGSNLLLQMRGEKHFLAFTPNDPAVVSKQSLREFFTANANPPSLRYDPAFDAAALVLDLQPGLGIYMPSTSPHCTETRGHDLSVTSSLSFVSPLADRLRRCSVFDAKLPMLRFVPGRIKYGFMAGYESMKRGSEGYQPRHRSFRPLPL